MGFFADLRARLMWSLRTQTPAGGQWLGEQLKRLFPPDRSDRPEGRELLKILESLDKWALELAPESYLGRLRPMVETWAQKHATEPELERAVAGIGDDIWLMDALERVQQRDPGNVWTGVGLIMLQGAFKKAGLITKRIYHDDFKIEVVTNWT